MKRSGEKRSTALQEVDPRRSRLRADPASFRPLNNLPLCFETLVVATIESCRYDKKLENDKKWREEKYGTPGNRSPEQEAAC